jgi:hypothetical protein
MSIAALWAWTGHWMDLYPLTAEQLETEPASSAYD